SAHAPRGRLTPVRASGARLLLLLPTTTYRTEAFVEAAAKLGVELVCASERASTLEHLAPDALVTLDFADPLGSAETIARFAPSASNSRASSGRSRSRPAAA